MYVYVCVYEYEYEYIYIYIEREREIDRERERERDLTVEAVHRGEPDHRVPAHAAEEAGEEVPHAHGQHRAVAVAGGLREGLHLTYNNNTITDNNNANNDLNNYNSTHDISCINKTASTTSEVIRDSMQPTRHSSVPIYIYIYMYIERERDLISNVYIYIYICALDGDLLHPGRREDGGLILYHIILYKRI